MSELNIILNNVNRFTTAELESLVAKSPYFQQAHLLLAKKYQLEGNPKFDQQLQLAALYTRDRELLYELFQEKDMTETGLIPPTILAPIEEPEEELLQPEERTREIALIPLTPEEIEVPRPNPAEDSLLTIEMDRADEAPVVLETASLDEPIVRETEDVLDELPLGEETALLPEEALLTAEEELQEEIAFVEQPEIPVVEKPKEKPFAMDQAHSFSEWLNAFSDNTPALSEPETAEKILTPEISPEEPETELKEDELSEIIQENISADYLHNIVHEETNYTRGLNDFIEEQIKKRKAPVAAKKTANENDIAPEMITETMAKIYEMQKKYAKAIKAYEVLSLKMPEKSDLFAARINYLKNIT